MSTVLLSHRACGGLVDYLLSRGHRLRLLGDDPRCGPGVEAHPDLRFCKAGPAGPVLGPSAPPRAPAYPDNAAMCAVLLDGFLIHRLDVTDSGILQYARARGLREVNVRQGYTKCSCVTVDGESVITSDLGIGRALAACPGITVLTVRAGHVSLPGFDTGFIGGASGRVGGEIVFNGDVSRHPDFQKMREFIVSRGLSVRYFPGEELTDIGSIIEIGGENL